MSFIVVPPTLDQTVMPLPTPSQEWTENTSALRSTPEDETGHTGTTAPPMARNPSGPTFPGGYNFTDDLESTATQRGSDTTLASTTTSVIDTAKQYIPQGAQQAFLNAGQTAKAYLPASVGAYIPGTGSSDVVPLDASLPSQEVAGAQPGEHTAGAGALPGSVSEEAVAQLPEERKAAESANGDERHARTLEQGRKDEQESGEDQTKVERDSASRKLTHAVVGANVDVAAGALQDKWAAHTEQPPTANKELNPHPTQPYTQLPTPPSSNALSEEDQPQTATKSHAQGQSQDDVKEASETRSAENEAGDVPKEADGKPLPFDGYGAGYHPALMNPMQASATPQKERENGHERTGSAGSGSNDEGRRDHGGEKIGKVSLRDRIRGETKVVIGKIGHREDKVEEGRRILKGSREEKR